MAVMGRATRFVVLAALAGVGFTSPHADAEDRPSGARRPPSRPHKGVVPPERALALINRPHTVAEFEAGIIALPNAPISNGQRGGSAPITIGKGDATIQTGLHLLYRARDDFAFGAGFLFAPAPTADEEYGGLSGLKRTHARSYLLFGAEGRYIPLHFKSFEGWVGLTAGGVVIADRFTTEASDPVDRVPAILGTRQVTVRTEGFAFGVQTGANYVFADRWVVGADFRLDRWLLPTSPQCTPIGDCATLSGTVAAFELGLTIGYRLPL